MPRCWSCRSRAWSRRSRPAAAAASARAIVFASGFAEVDEAGRAEQDGWREVARDGRRARSSARTASASPISSTAWCSPSRPSPPQPIAGRPAVGGVTAKRRAGRRPAPCAASPRARRLARDLDRQRGRSRAPRIFSPSCSTTSDTRAVALFVEQIRRPQLFLRSPTRARAAQADRAAASGQEQRARANPRSSHTGALAGDHAVMTALSAPPGGGPGRHHRGADRCRRCADARQAAGRRRRHHDQFGRDQGLRARLLPNELGLDIPQPAPATRRGPEDRRCPPTRRLDNPVDVTAQVIKEPAIWTRAAQALLADPRIGSLGLADGAGRSATGHGQGACAAARIVAARQAGGRRRAGR